MKSEIGCLVVGNSERMTALTGQLSALGVCTRRLTGADALLSAAQEGLLAVRRPGGVCVAAEGRSWAVAAALAAQLHVDRIALIAPVFDEKHSKDHSEKQIARLMGYARRNLFFCISDVLILEPEDSLQLRGTDGLCRHMCNARIQRAAYARRVWDSGRLPLRAALLFLSGRDCAVTLAQRT